MLTVTLAALIMSIAIPTFIGINRGAVAKQASYMVYAGLNQAQQKAAITRQRVGFYIVTQVITPNPWVDNNMTNRSFFLYAADTPGVAKAENFITTVQTLPAPMMFDFSTNGVGSSDSIPTLDMVHPGTGVPYFKARGFRFAPAGGLHAYDLDLSSSTAYQFRVVVAEGVTAVGGGYSLKPIGAIRYTNTVNGFTGKVLNH